jgi:hypothetical protein
MNRLLSRILATHPGAQSKALPQALQLQDTDIDGIPEDAKFGLLPQSYQDRLKQALVAELEIGDAIRRLNQKLAVRVLNELVADLSRSRH